jgi:hypothetical protein
MNVEHYATCFRARNIALDRASRLQGFELSTAGSSPGVSKSCGADRDVSTARCQQNPRGGGGTAKSVPSAPLKQSNYRLRHIQTSIGNQAQYEAGK